MRKWILIMMLTMLCAPLMVRGAVEVQISVDNTTWTDVTETEYGGAIDETAKKSYASLLEEGTVYYLRAKDINRSWTYLQQQTIWGGETTMTYIIIGITMIGVTFLFALFAVKAKNIALQIGLSLMTMVMVVFDLFMSARVTEVTQSAQTGLISNLYAFYEVAMTLMVFLMWGVLFYVLYLLYKLFRDWNKMKYKKREEEYLY